MHPSADDIRAAFDYVTDPTGRVLLFLTRHAPTHAGQWWTASPKTVSGVRAVGGACCCVGARATFMVARGDVLRSVCPGDALTVRALLDDILSEHADYAGLFGEDFANEMGWRACRQLAHACGGNAPFLAELPPWSEGA
jgi:hypothetical protein